MPKKPIAPAEPDELLEDDLELAGELPPSDADADAFQPTTLQATPADVGLRLDQFLVANIPDVSRARVQQLLEQENILVNGSPAKPSLKLRGTEQIAIVGRAQVSPLKAIAEDIPLDVVYEDKDLAIINKPAGMLVHAGAGTGDDPRNRGTLVNALLFHFKSLSELGGELRPGIVHRLDKDTSGLIVVAKNDVAHRKLGDQFASRDVSKRYIALVHGTVKQDRGTITASISRDRVQRTRMTTRPSQGSRSAISHYTVVERITSPFGRFTLVEVKIDTGRTHQIRVHMASIGHPVVGDTLYGAPSVLSPQTLERESRGTAISVKRESKKGAKSASGEARALSLPRNFLHAASIRFNHPKTGKPLSFDSPLPEELQRYLERLREAEGEK